MKRRDLALLALGAALLYLPFLGARDLWNPNEPTYGQAVSEMSASGAWLVPTVNGEPFLEKPPLYFWLARSFALALGGPGEFALRLPSAVSGIALVLLTYLLVVPYAGARRARLAAAVLGSTYIVFWSARSAQMDLLLAVCSLGAVVAGTRVLDHGLAAWRGWGLVGLATGLGFLAKGPVAVVTAGLPLLLHAQVGGRLRELTRPAVAVGALAFAVVVAPWVAAAWTGGETEYLREVVVRQTLLRAVAPWDHQGAWWYYLRELWVDLAPWSVFLPLAVGLPALRAGERQLGRLAWAWLAGLIVFFSLSQSKRSPYLLPAWPAAAILISGVADGWLRGTLERWRSRLALALVIVLGVGFAAAGVAARVWAVPRWPLAGSAGTALAAVLVAGGIAVLVAAVFAARSPRAAPVALFAAVVAIYAVAGAWTLPAFDAYKSARAFGERIAVETAAGDPVRSYATWEWRAGYSYYARRPIERLATTADLLRYWNGPGRVLLVVEADRLDAAREAIGAAVPLASATVGSRGVELFESRPKAQP